MQNLAIFIFINTQEILVTFDVYGEMKNYKILSHTNPYLQFIKDMARMNLVRNQITVTLP